MSIRFHAATLALIAGLGFGGRADAQALAPTNEAAFFPQWNNTVEMNIRFDGAFASRNRPSRLATVFADVEWFSAIHFNRQWSVQALFHFAPMRVPTRDGLFRDQGLYVRNLYLNHQGDGFALFAGKYDPGFGVMWSEDLPGLFTNFFSEEYRLTEGLGAGGTLELPVLGIGRQEIGFNLFMFDNTFLSNAVFTRPRIEDFDTERPGRVRFRDGGPGNTRGPTSFTVTLNGGEMPQLPGFSYHLAFMRLARGSDAMTAEPSRDAYGTAVALRWTRLIQPDLRFIGMAEAIWFWNVNVGEDVFGAPAFGWNRFLTGLVALEYDDHWLLSAAGTLRSTGTNAVGPLRETHDWLLTASLEYMPVNGMRLGIGYRAVREVPIIGDDTRPYTSHTIGLRFRYVFGLPTATLGAR